jgi:hypothetical protein
MMDAMRIEARSTPQESRTELAILDILLSAFEHLDRRILDELMAGGDFLDAARRAFKAKNRVRRFLADRPGLRVDRRFAPALEKVRNNEGHHVDEFERLLRIGTPTAVDWDEVVFVDGPDNLRFHYEGTA